MKTHTIDGHEVEISQEEIMRLYSTLRHDNTPTGIAEKRHNFMIGGKTIGLTPEEMKEVANAWWDKYGKQGMTKFFEHYQKKAAENIRKALGHLSAPSCEKEVKGAIAQAVSDGDSELMAEVLFESMEWETAYSALESIED